MSMTDIFGTTLSVGDFIVDENGNVGKIINIQHDERALVDFGKSIGTDMVYIGEKIKKGKYW